MISHTMNHPLNAVISLVLALAWTGPGRANDNNSDRTQALLELLQGRYQSAAVLEPDRPGPQLTDHRIRVDSPALGEAVVYWQLNSGPEQHIYRQRLLIFAMDSDSGKIIQQTWSLAEPMRFDANEDQAALFATLDQADLIRELPESCDPVWQAHPDGWYAHTDPERCRIFSERHQDWRHIEAEVLLSAAGLQQAERGFDGQGRQLFGSPPGELFRLYRVNP